MIKKKIESFKYVLEEQDIQTIKECLNYCYHRLTKHKCEAPIDLDKVQRLRSEFGVSLGVSLKVSSLTKKRIEKCYPKLPYPQPP